MAKNIIRATLQIQLSASQFLLNNSSLNRSRKRKTLIFFYLLLFENITKKYSQMAKNIILET